MAEEPNGRRRSRRRATAQQGPPKPPETPPAGPVVETAVKAVVKAFVEAPNANRTSKPRRENRGGTAGAKGARGDRDLAGSGSSQVGPTGAMRARDLNRPTPEDLAEAEADLDIVRRHWTPTSEQPESRPVRRRRP